MAVSLRMTPAPEAPPPQTSEIAAVLTAPAQAYLARLAALHDEAAETAHLANLVGRTPWAVGAMAVGALAVAGLGATLVPVAPLAAWLILVIAGAMALTRTYARAIAAPFDRDTLKSFTRTLSAALFFAGFAWGAGAFLALPAGTGLALGFVFVGAVPAVLATLFRSRDLAMSFLVPATAMGAFCALMGGAGGLAMIGMAMGGLVTAAGCGLVERMGPAPRSVTA